MMPRVEVVCIGTELLTFKANAHSAYLGGRLADAGLFISRDHTLPDEPELMRQAFSEIWKRADIVISCGGLGPTFDDVTRDVWARVLKRPLKFNSALLADIAAKFKRRGISMPPANRRQAYVLAGAHAIANANGTAPGQALEMGNKILFLLPGPARELKPMVESYVLPQIKTKFPGHARISKSFHFFGIAESTLDHDVRPLVKKYPRIGSCAVTHGILASQSVVTVKFTVEGNSEEAARVAAEFLEKKFLAVLKNRFFARDNQTLTGLLLERFRARRQTLATAESCTGGLISKLLTDEPGSSDYVIEGVVTYSNRSKMKRLNVRAATLDRYGAVSVQTAREMADGLRRSAGVHYALSVTGIAGPGGGTVDKPVGLVFIGCAGPRRTVVEKFHFGGDRATIRQRAAIAALLLLYQQL